MTLKKQIVQLIIEFCPKSNIYIQRYFTAKLNDINNPQHNVEPRLTNTNEIYINIK